MISLFVLIAKAFSRRERLLFLGASVVFVVSGILIGMIVINQKTELVPNDGGSYSEGIVGQLSFVNPLLAKPNSPDSDLVTLLFASAQDLAESVKHDDSYKVWNLRLKDGAVWHDGTPVTSDDIIFTIQTIQNPDTLSPLFSDWQNVAWSRISEREIQFELASPYTMFSNILRDLRPVPKKLFADLSPAHLKLSPYMLEPIGSGPFVYDYLEKRRDGFISAYHLKSNEQYNAISQIPHIKNFTISFYENNVNLIKAYNLGLVDGFGTYDKSLLDQIKLNSSILSPSSSKYYGLFFNQNANDALTSRNVRLALNEAIDKNGLVREVMDGEASVEHGPIPSSLSSYNPAIEPSDQFNPDDAKYLISSDGWQYNSDINVWEKNQKNKTIQLSVTIKAPDIWPLNDIAKYIQNSWNSVGVKTDLALVDFQTINNEAIRTRDYEVLLFGNIVFPTPDLYSLWHSSQKFYPGTNLALYDNLLADQTMEAIRKTDVSSDKRKVQLDQLQEIIIEDAPAVFLLSPRYFYIHKHNITGISIDIISLPENRFNEVTDWYVKTRRVLK
jgi:peptide/nickel transport system substrate-binding protein